jgi:hypothetical protein
MRANFAIMRSIYRTLNDCDMQHNAEVGLFTKPSRFPIQSFNDIHISQEIKTYTGYLTLML